MSSLSSKMLTLPWSSMPKKTIQVLLSIAILCSMWAVRPRNLLQNSGLQLYPGTDLRYGRWATNYLSSKAMKTKEDTSNFSAKKSVVTPLTRSMYQPGTIKLAGEPYSKTIVIARTEDESVDWLYENFSQNEDLRFAIYTADNLTAEYHPPANKGHEVLIYLSYIIEHYHKLSEVSMFLHAHRHSWHNNELLGHDAVEMISRLSAERVQREGYVNMRCQWDPGCPTWMHPGIVEEDPYKQEGTLLAKSWSEIFPHEPIPKVLAQPCCAQFAVSRNRIQAVQLAQYIFYSDWLLRTRLPDAMSGRVWEYLWQFVFTGDNIYCPQEHICNCDGYGICFGGQEEYNTYQSKKAELRHLQDELNHCRENGDEDSRLSEKQSGWEERPPREIRLDETLQKQIDNLTTWCHDTLVEAKQRGLSMKNRASEVARQ